ncbi:MAG: site-2 protease family protein [bacterium]
MGILIFVLTIAFLILVHELGHFSVARLFKVKVEEFACGFPPRIWSKKVGKTTFSLNLIPLGGFVRLYGEDGKHAKEENSYSSKTWWQKSLIGVAGVFANFVFAAIILAIGYNIGLPRMVTDYSNVSGVNTENQIVVVEVNKDSLAEQIKLKPGDTILRILPGNNEKTISRDQKSAFRDMDDFKANLAKYKNQEVELIIKRKGNLKTISASFPDKNEDILGVYIVENSIYRFGFFKSLWIGILETAKLIVYIAVSLYVLIKNLIISGQVADFATGPVGIYYMAGGVSKLGLSYILQFIGFISINLGIINLLPIPALDGGRIVFNVIEGIRRKPLDSRIENTIHTIGFIVIIVLVILIFYRDILRIPYYRSIFG